MTAPLTRAAAAAGSVAVPAPAGEPPARLIPELAGALAGLSHAEQALLARAVRSGRRGPGRRPAPLTDVSLVNEFLKMDPEIDDASVFQNIAAFTAPPVIQEYPGSERVALPEDLLPADFPLAEVIAKRASRRDFSKGPLSLPELATLLARAYGVRARNLAYNVKGFPSRFVPSTGGLQAVEVYLVANAVEGLEQGLYHFNPARHCLELLDRGNLRRKVVKCCIFQDWTDAASVVLFLTCDLRKLYWKYGRRSYRFVHVDVGILAQTLHLVATALRLRSCMIAGYDDDRVHDLLAIDGREELIGLLMAVGRKPWEPRPPDAAEPSGAAGAPGEPEP